MQRTRHPSLAAVRSAASTLSQAARHEAQRIREKQGAGGHAAAQDLEQLAFRVEGLASLIESVRQGER